VVALEEVLADDLPVRVEARLCAVVVAEVVHVHANRGDELRQLAERLGERRRVGVGIHEDERPPGVGLHRDERDLLRVEAGLAVGAGRRAQAPVETVRPGVVAALERGASSLPLRHLEPAVAADVHEGAKLVVAVAGDDDRHETGAPGEVAARLGDLPGVPDVLPGATEDALLLGPQNCVVDVPGPGIRLASGHESLVPRLGKRVGESRFRRISREGSPIELPRDHAAGSITARRTLGRRPGDRRSRRWRRRNRSRLRVFLLFAFPATVGAVLAVIAELIDWRRGRRLTTR
jgi:hypothetical protein